MRVTLSASHLLHWRVLIPVACELAKRGHSLHIQTNRPGWLGLPHFRMAFRPQTVAAINEAALDWVADLIGYRNWWTKAKSSARFGKQSGEADCVVSTTKDLNSLKASGRPFVAVGYQHLPLLLATRGRWEPYGELPPAFRVGHPFERQHRFVELYSGLDVYRCGFPHLDHLAARIHPTPSKSLRVLLVDHGGYRGLGWPERHALCRLIQDCGASLTVSSHPVPGLGYGPTLLSTRLGVPTVRGTWPTGLDMDVILATGSSTLYEAWSVGLRNAYVVGFLGGVREKVFRGMGDLYLHTVEQLRSVLLSPERRVIRDPVAIEIMESFRVLHDGQGAKRASDAIERVAR